MNPGLPEEQQFILRPGTLTIGRTKDNAVSCLHKSLSRKHAQVDFDGMKVRVTDLQSKNGLFYNGKRVSQCELLEGDSFRCGDITFLVESATTRSPKAAVPPQQDRTAQTLPSPFVIDPNVSRRHAEIRVSYERGVPDLSVVDLGSTNGIKVGGQRVQEAQLGPGSRITIGNTTLTVVLSDR